MYSINDIKALKENVPDIAHAYGITSLSTIGEYNASRGMMLANNLRQTVVLKSPEPPRILTGAENTFGKLSHGYKQADGDWKVLEKIQKYKDGNIYSIVLYNEETNTIDIIENPFAEDGPERFGYVYNSANMDSKNVGDVIHNGEVLYKSTSYDDDMNYCMGINARVAYLTGPSTFEDGVTIRRGFADSVHTYEITSFMVSINNNDVPLLIHEYDGKHHSIPKIGQEIGESSTVIATRKYNKRKVAFDFDNVSITKIRPTDISYKAGHGSIIYDMDIFYNNKNNPFPDNDCYRELHDYYEEQCEYYRKLYKLCEEYKSAGYNRTSNAILIHKLAKDFVEVCDDEYAWKDKERAFANICVKFKCVRETGLHEGFKLVGRYGDKGVISQIRKDTDYEKAVVRRKYNPEDPFDKAIAMALGMDGSEIDNISIIDDSYMPYDEKGRRVDILKNASGAIRRLNPGQISEMDLTFIAERIQDRVEELSNEGKIDEAFELICGFVADLDPREWEVFANEYGVKLSGISNFKASTKAKKMLVDDIIKDGFYIYKLPNNDLRFDKICYLYDKYPFIKRYTMYIDKFGIKHKIVNPMVVGYEYTYVLKQTSNKNFSARNMGKVNKIGCPTKSADKKENRTNISDTPINRGETYNLMASLNATQLVTSDTFTKNSPVARRDLKNILTATGNPFKASEWKIKKTYQNVNVSNFKARLKTMGIGYDFITNSSIIKSKLQDYKTFIEVYDFTFYDYGRNADYYKYLVNTYLNIKRTGTKEQLADIWQAVQSDSRYKYVDPPKSVFDIVKQVLDVCEPIELNEDEKKDEKEGEADNAAS